MTTETTAEPATEPAPPPPAETPRGLYHDAEGDGRYHFVENGRCRCEHPYNGQRLIDLADKDLGFKSPEEFCDAARAALSPPKSDPAAAPAAKEPIAPAAHAAAIAKTAERAVVPFLPRDTQEMFRYANFLAASELIPFALRKKPNDILVVLLKGQDLGLTPMQSIAGINVIDGKAEVGALMMVSLILRSGMCEYWELEESTLTQCTYVTKRRGGRREIRFTYTIEEAEAAGLTKKGGSPEKIARSPWNTQRRTMLRRRCQSFLAREVYPDICAGLYDHDELQEVRDLERELIRTGMEATRAGFRVVDGASETLPGWMASGAHPVTGAPAENFQAVERKAQPDAPPVEIVDVAPPAAAEPVRDPAPPTMRDPMRDRLARRAKEAKNAQGDLLPDEVACDMCGCPIEPPKKGEPRRCRACLDS